MLAIADDVHIVQHFDHELRATGSKEQAFKSSITHLFAPLLGASGTTALGMLSLATSDVVAVRTFGIGAAIGVMVDFAISLVFVPTLLTLVRPDTVAAAAGAVVDGAAAAVGRFAFSHARLVLAVVLVADGRCRVGHHAAARRHQSHQLFRRRTIRCRAPRPSSIGSSRASTASTSCSKARRIR